MPIPTAILLACRLWGLSLACGVNVYATIAVVGLASRLGWVDALPPPLVGLEQWLLIAGAAALFLVEVVARALPWIEPGWETVHTVIRPVSALTLTFVGLETAPWPIRALASLVAGAASLSSHAAKVGLHLSFPVLRPKRILWILAETVLVAGLALATLMSAATAIAAFAVAAGLVTFVGPAFWRATFFAARAMVARLRGFFAGRDWHPASALPRGLFSLLPPAETGRAPLRIVRGALHTDRAGPWRNGYLAFDHGMAWFLYRQAFRPRRIAVHRPAETSIRPGFLADIIEARLDSGDLVLHLLKDGPDAEIVVGALQLILDPPETPSIAARAS
jgi:hypothetical protein